MPKPKLRNLKVKLIKQKHDALKKLGIKPPGSDAENRERAKAAHGY